MLGIILALIVAFLKSLWELAGKVFTDEKQATSLDEYSLSLWARLLSFVLLLPLVIYFWFPYISQSLWMTLFVSSLLGSVATVTALKAVKYGDLSLVSPLTALTIPFLLITSYLITHEVANLYGYIGVLVIFFWTYFLQLHEAQRVLLGPIKAIFTDSWARYMIVTALIWSITSPIDKIWVVELGALNWMFLTNACITIILAIYMFLMKKGFSLKQMTQTHAIKKVWAITVLWGLWIFLQMLALKYTLVIYVIALKRASGMFSVFLGWIFYKEKNILEKFTAAAIMLCWVIIISLFGNI